MTPTELASQLNSISSATDASQLLRLESLCKAMSQESVTAEVYRAMLGLFERFPDDDAYGGFWSVLHILEKCRQFEPLLVDSIRRIPAQFTLYMADRLLNGGYSNVENQDLRALLRDALSNPILSTGNREFVEQSMFRHAIPEGTKRSCSMHASED